MFRLAKAIKFVLGLALFATLVVACGPPETITESITEAEFNEEDPGFCQDIGVAADFQPGKIVCSGEYQGEAVVLELTLEIVGTGARLQMQRLNLDGQDVPADDFAEYIPGLAEDIYTPEEGYVVTGVSITDEELTITSSLQD